MNTFIESVTSNKVLLIILILSASLLVYSILKHLVKMIIIIIIALAIYLFYMNYSGQKPDKKIQNYYNEGLKEFNKLQQKGEQINRINDSINKLKE